jgi:hypothetical protein
MAAAVYSNKNEGSKWICGSIRIHQVSFMAIPPFFVFLFCYLCDGFGMVISSKLQKEKTDGPKIR